MLATGALACPFRGINMTFCVSFQADQNKRFQTVLVALTPYAAFIELSNKWPQVDLNAPLSKDSPPVVTNATRLSAACPTINLLAEKGAKVILASHLGRPKKQVVDGLRMDPVAVKLSELLGKEVGAVVACHRSVKGGEGLSFPIKEERDILTAADPNVYRVFVHSAEAGLEK